ncbi:dimethylarginine dimethylaminohydrolase family protein [Streptomyces triculaminicus]|uniref:dimethylarginine dimethylaminohydrolase family protein n=1 Tax=Streptomyces triculaminicus TaxID=2816232 RepID=UPI0037D37C8F
MLVHATSEFGTLRRVAMRYAGDFTRPLTGPHVHPVTVRQMTTSSYAPYGKATVRSQQNDLIRLLRDRGTEVILLDEADGCSWQHYTRDIAFVIDDVLFFARLNSGDRRPEADALVALTAGALRVARLEAGTVEGGDIMLHTGIVLAGLSEETSMTGIGALRSALVRHGIDREVIPVRFSTDGIVHLDDHFTIAAPGTALVHRPVFPGAQIRWFEQHFDLIEVTDEEALAVQANVLAIAPGTVVVTDGSDRIAAELAARGIKVLTINYSEVTRLPGSLRCTTLPLLRD